MNENNIDSPITEMTAAEMLRNARTTGRRKREIPTIAKQLCIREEFLQALEDGKYSQIPETVYILGFARNYAMELGLNPDEIVNKIKREMGLLSDCADNAEACEDVAVATKNSVWGAAKAMTKRAWDYIVRHWQWFAGGLVVLLILVAMLTLVSRTGDDASVDNAVSAVSVAPTDTEPQYAVAVRERFGTENRATGEVVLQATQESWVKLEDGRGNTVFSRVLVPGDVFYVPAGDKYRATFGNAGGIDIWVGGTKAPKVGENHTTKSDISLSPKSLLK